MVVAAPGPQGAALLADAPFTTPLTYSAATPAAGLPGIEDNPFVSQLAWWRLDVPVGPDRQLYMDATHSTMPDGAQALVMVYMADGFLAEPPADVSGLQEVNAVFADTLTLPGGRSYFIGMATYTGDAYSVVPSAVYRLLLSDYGQQVAEQLPDVEAVWAYRNLPGLPQTQQQPTPDPQNRYDLNVADVGAGYGPGFGAEMLIIGTLFDNDPGSMTQENADRNTGHRAIPTAPAQVEANAIATSYLSFMSYHPEASLHLWQMQPRDADGVRPNEPIVPLTTVRTDTGDQTWVGYIAQAVDGNDAPGRYLYREQAASEKATLSTFAEWVGPSANTPDALVAQAIWDKYGTYDYTFDGEATLVNAWMKPDVIAGGVNPSPRQDDPSASPMPTVWIDWSEEWRTPHVTQSDPVNGDPLNPPQKWGPNQQVQVWSSAGGAPWHLETPNDVRDIYDQNMQGWHWLGSGKVLPGMRDKPTMPLDDWTPIPNVAELVAWEKANPGMSSVCAAVLPVPMHQGTSPVQYGLKELGDSPWTSMAATWRSKLVFKTVIRPAPVLVNMPPEVPTIGEIPVWEPWLRALQRSDGLGVGGPPRAVQQASGSDSLRGGPNAIQ